MALSGEHLTAVGPGFADELLSLLAKYELHDGSSRLVVSNDNFRIRLDDMRPDCPEACKVCELVTLPSGKQQLVCRCIC